MGCCISKDENFDYTAELMTRQELRSVEVKADEDAKDVGPIHRNAKFANQIVDAPFEGKDDKTACRTIWYGFSRGYDRFPNAKCLGTRKLVNNVVSFHWQTYAEVFRETQEIAAGLVALGGKPTDTVGICSANRAEWSMLALATYSQRMVAVALYDTLGTDAVEYIINHAETKFAACSKKKLPLVLGVLDKCPKLKTVIQFDTHPEFGNNEPVSEDDRKKALDHGVRLIGWSELRALGLKEKPQLHELPTSKDLAFIMYTSGTTGQPKGVMLTHANVMACVGGTVRTVIELNEHDVHISYLPLAHIFETLVQTALLTFGGAIGFFSGDIKTIGDDLKALEPTIFAGVPRVFSRFYDKVMENVRNSGGIKHCVVMRKYQAQCHRVRRGLPADVGADQKIFKVIRTRLGLHKCRAIVTGAAPCPPFLMEFCVSW